MAFMGYEGQQGRMGGMAESRKWAIGDVCRLKSGGPLMVIVEVVDMLVKCEWFSEAGDVRSAKFDVRCLS